MYAVVLEFKAEQFFEDASASLQQRLDRCFDQLKANPTYHPNIKALKGELSGYYRYRVGDYRVVYYISDEPDFVVTPDADCLSPSGV
ncbi:MAG: type II toxin-antitoxin system RelE/ParE family toxin [Coleofasciculaceae cyanobacterium]